MFSFKKGGIFRSMVPYIVLVGVPALLSFLSMRITVKDQKRKTNFVIAFFFLFFIALVSFRASNIGNDTGNYALYYEYFGKLSWNKLFDYGMEPAYVVLMKIIHVCGLNCQAFFAVVALISIVPIWIFYTKEKNASLYTIALFLGIVTFSMYFSGLRQIIAMAFAFPAYHFSRNKKPFLFLIMVLFSFLFHRSAFILLFIYPLCNFKITFKWLGLVVPFIGVVFLFNEPIFTFLTIFVGDMYSTETSPTGAYAILILLVLFAIYSFFIPDENQIDSDTMAMRNILLLCICLQCFAPIHELAMRMNYYFFPFLPVLLTRIANKASEKNIKLAQLSVIIMTVFFIAYFFYNLSQGGGLNIYPYVPFWSES